MSKRLVALIAAGLVVVATAQVPATQSPDVKSPKAAPKMTPAEKKQALKDLADKRLDLVPGSTSRPSYWDMGDFPDRDGRWYGGTQGKGANSATDAGKLR